MAYAVETISSLPFGHLIGGPLVAGIEAQAQAAKSTVDFILEVGFNPSNEDPFLTSAEEEEANPQIGDVRMITFEYKTKDGDKEYNASVVVPLLSVIPIPFFSIDEMTIDFMAKSQKSKENPHK